MPHELKYEVLVSARSPEEALEIAAEGLGPEQRMVRSEVLDVSAEEGRDSYRVTIWFVGGRRGGDGPSD
jgi:hypothetical protein